MSVDVSVIVPTFRRPAMLREALQSALAQEGPSVEVIVLDDSPEASARGTVEALADPRIRYVARAVPSQGRPSLVRNEGWPLARGTYLHFLDDDDRVAPGAYRDAVQAFARTKAGVIFGRVEPFGDDEGDVRHEREVFARGARAARRYQRLGSRLLLVAHEYFTGPPLFVNSDCLLRREVVAQVGGYDPELTIVEDLDFMIRAIRASGFEFLDRPILEYRITPGSLMSAHRNGSAAVADACRRMYRKYRNAHGALEFLSLKVAGRVLLPLLWTILPLG
jgi:glycosyltransferase involved in cell wall biosynthesis